MVIAGFSREAVFRIHLPVIYLQLATVWLAIDRRPGEWFSRFTPLGSTGLITVVAAAGFILIGYLNHDDFDGTVLALALCPIFATTLGIGLAANPAYLAWQGKETSAIVLHEEERRIAKGNGDHVHVWRYEFADGEGRPIPGVMNSGSDDYQPGQLVRIQYDPAGIADPKPATRGSGLAYGLIVGIMMATAWALCWLLGRRLPVPGRAAQVIEPG